MVIMRDDIGNKVVHNPLNPVFRNYAEEEGKGIRSLVVAAVATSLLVPVLAIDGRSGLFSKLRIVSRILRPLGNDCHL